MVKVKNQHYVPRSYLKYFANKKDQIWVYDKQTNRFFLSNINNVASERYFYDIPFEEIYNVLSSEDREKVQKIIREGNLTSITELAELGEQSMEKFFAENIENNFKKLLDKIRVSYIMMPSPLYSRALSQEDCIQLSLMLAFQIVRSKEFRESHFDSKKSMTQAMVDIFASSYEEDYKIGSITAEPQY